MTKLYIQDFPDDNVDLQLVNSDILSQLLPNPAIGAPSPCNEKGTALDAWSKRDRIGWTR